MDPKDYLMIENQRNRDNAALYEAFLKRALGAQWVVLTGHHFLYERDGDASTEGEIPSADTVLFDHDIMSEVFGADAERILVELAKTPAYAREQVLAREFARVQERDKAERRDAAQSMAGGWFKDHVIVARVGD